MKDRTRQAAEWLTDKYIMLMLLVFPLFMGIHGYVKITLSKYLFFSITTGLWLAGILLLWIVGGAHKRLLPVQLLVIAWGAWACLSSAVSPWRTESLLGASRFDGLLTLLLYVGIFCGVSAYGSWRPRYVWLLGCSAAICAAVSFFQIAGASILFPNGYTYYDAGVLYISKFLGTIGNTNLLAAFLCMSVPLCAAAEACGWKAVWFLRGVYMSGACLLSFTESSGGMLALAVAYTVCALAFAGKGRLPQFIKIAARTAFGLGIGSLLRNAPGEACALFLMAGMAFAAACGFQRFIPVRYHFCCTIFILAAVLLFGGALVYFWPVSSGTIYELSRLLHGEVQDSFGSSRIRIWRETLALVPERMLFGGGPGTLALRFRELLGQIDHLVNRNLRKQLSVTQAQVKMLQAQIHPHFLYNTLDSITALAQSSNNRKIAQMTMALARFMRASFRWDTHVSLDDEVLLVQEYLKIYRIRYENRLDALIDYRAEDGGVLMPKMILQPLVENAVKYGLEKKVGVCRIRVRLRRRGQRLSISVWDNGVGFPKEQAAAFEHPENFTQADIHGLHNVARRLYYTYGDSMGIRIRSRENCWTNISVMIPAGIPMMAKEVLGDEKADDRG